MSLTFQPVDGGYYITEVGRSNSDFVGTNSSGEATATFAATKTGRYIVDI